MTTLRIISQRDFFIAIILYTSFPNAFKWLVTSRKLSFYFKARTCLDPLFRLNLSVSVQVRTEIPVSAHPAGGEALLQLVHQQAEGGALFRCPCVCRASSAVQTAFIADSDTRRIESLHVCPDAFDGTGKKCRAVFADIVVVSCSVESPSPVQRLQVKGRQCPVHPRCRAVDHD